jgi:hypothetical protein
LARASFDAVRQQIDVTADGELIKLLNELSGYPAPGGGKTPRATLHEDTFACGTRICGFFVSKTLRQ